MLGRRSARRRLPDVAPGVTRSTSSGLEYLFHLRGLTGLEQRATVPGGVRNEALPYWKDVAMKAPSKPRKSLQRRDATGHLNPKYAADLRQRSLASGHHDADVAFFGRAKSSDSLAESLGEEFVASATAGEGGATDAHNQSVPEDTGGPFIITRARDEFAQGPDPSNPLEATREPFPTSQSAEDDPEA